MLSATKLFWVVVGSSRYRVLLAAVSGLGAGVASAVVLSVIHQILEGLAPSELAIQFAVALVCLVVCRVVVRIALVRIGQQAIKELRTRIAHAVLRSPLYRLETLGHGPLTAALTEDVAHLGVAVPGIPILVSHFAVIAGASAYMLASSPRLFLLVLLAAATGAVLFRGPMKAARRGFQAARQEQDRLHALLQGMIKGIKELKLHRPRRDEFLTGGLEISQTKYLEHTVAAQRASAVAVSWGQSMFIATVGVVLFAGPWLTGAGPAEAAAFVVAILYLQSPLEFVYEWIPLMARARASLDRLNALGVLLKDEGDTEAVKPKTTFSSLRFREVTYQHPADAADSTFVVGPLSFELKPKQVVLIAGGNGSGKTTLGKLLVGLYSAGRGDIAVDGRSLSAEWVEDYRSLFTTVFTDSHLFNPAFGVDLAHPQTSVMLERFGLASRISIRDNAFSDTQLSDGQRRRALLLVARVEDRPIYVFDEWAANQDPEFKQFFYREFVTALRDEGKCVVVISHDDRYFDVADRLWVLDRGQLAEARGSASSSPSFPEVRRVVSELA